MRTSGATVVFSGITVIISLAGLFLIDSTVMRSLAIGAIVVVAIAIIGAVTLLPALIALLGHRADERGKIVTFTGPRVPARSAREADARGRPELLGSVVERGHEALGAPRPSLAAVILLVARDPGALAAVRQRRAAPVPGRPRDPRRRRAAAQAVRPASPRRR